MQGLGESCLEEEEEEAWQARMRRKQLMGALLNIVLAVWRVMGGGAESLLTSAAA